MQRKERLDLGHELNNQEDRMVLKPTEKKWPGRRKNQDTILHTEIIDKLSQKFNYKERAIEL